MHLTVTKIECWPSRRERQYHVHFYPDSLRAPSSLAPTVVIVMSTVGQEYDIRLRINVT
jgi:hypothetical protein